MLRYVLKRTLMVIPILLAVVLIVFTIMELTPGTPGRVLLGELAAQEEVDQLDHKLGTDQPFFYRYFQYIKDIVLRFDFGVSYRTQKPVVKEILSRFPYTLKITFLAVLGSSVIGIPIGVLMAAKRNMLIDRTVNIDRRIVFYVPHRSRHVDDLMKPHQIKRSFPFICLQFSYDQVRILSVFAHFFQRCHRSV